MTSFTVLDRLEELDSLIDAVRMNPLSAQLLKSVAQNPAEQTVDLQLSCASVGAELSKHDATALALCSEPMSTLLRKLVHFAWNTIDLRPGDALAHWLYENSTRLKKICIVRKIMSYRTLASFVGAGTPVRQKPLSIPTYILEAWNIICDFERRVEQEHSRLYIDQTVMRVDPDFLALADSEDARQRSLGDATEFIERTKRARIEQKE